MDRLAFVGCRPPRYAEYAAYPDARTAFEADSVIYMRIIGRLHQALIHEGRRRFELVSGGAAGVDLTAEAWARSKGLRSIIYPADWERYGRAAGMIRNRLIVAAATHVHAFQAPWSRGTLHIIGLAKGYGVPLTVYDHR